MLATSDIHRSISKMTVDLNEAIERRKAAGRDYEIAEREFQAQYEVFGNAGTLPVENDLKIKFNVCFLGDPGNHRDSQLDRPHFRHGYERVFGPPGVIPYVFIDDWTLDPDFNFIGVVLKVGAHYPALTIDTAPVPSSLSFKFVLHAAFQGFCAVWDPDGPLDGGGMQDDLGAH